MTVSIIIAVRIWQKNLEECVARIKELDYNDFEVIILPDKPFDHRYLQDFDMAIKVIPTGEVNPARKRDEGIKYAKGEIIAFLDDDAYPSKNWLKAAVEGFSDERIAAVGGPAVTPSNDNIKQKISGLVYSSFMMSGNFTYRYMPGKRRFVDDYPSCNFLVRKSVMLELGGFNTDFWPGEDTKLCLDITSKLKKKILYDPRALVYHHRREAYSGHLKQIISYALHRGYFVKKYPKNSLKASYFIPSFLVIFIGVGAVLAFFFTMFKIFYFSVILLYLTLAFIFSISKDLALIPAVFFGIISSHIAYGFYFLKGLLSAKLKEEN